MGLTSAPSARCAGRAHRLVSHPCAPRGRQRPSRAHRPGVMGRPAGGRPLHLSDGPEMVVDSARGRRDCSPRRVARPRRRTTRPVGRSSGARTTARRDVLLQRVRGTRGRQRHRVVPGTAHSTTRPSPAAAAGPGWCGRAQVRRRRGVRPHRHLGAARPGAGGLSSFAGREWRRASMPQAPEDVPSRRRGFPMGGRSSQLPMSCRGSGSLSHPFVSPSRASSWSRVAAPSIGPIAVTAWAPAALA